MSDKQYITMQSGNCTYQLVQNEGTAKVIDKITKLERRHAKMFKTPKVKEAKRVTKRESFPKPVLTIEERILGAINSGMSYPEVLTAFHVRNYQPYKSFGASQWERVKVQA